MNWLIVVLATVNIITRSNADVLQAGFYANSCPNLESIVFKGMKLAVQHEPRMAASILRLFFHDCFVQGCDASNLLDDSPSFKSEKNALPNLNSARGFDIVDSIKASVESACPKIVSCADILALAARDATVLSGGPTWDVQLGRRDARVASFDGANQFLPSPFSKLDSLLDNFQKQGLSLQDLVTLSGAHTIGLGQCQFFRPRLYNTSGNGKPDASMNEWYVQRLQDVCPGEQGVGDTNLVPLDPFTPSFFDNRYFINLLYGRGLFTSDQALFSPTSNDASKIIHCYAQDIRLFFSNFTISMVKLGNLKPLIDPSISDIRTNCRLVNNHDNKK